MDKIPYNPTVLLRCSKCLNKTSHVLINFSNNPATAITMVYECQDCGETKKVFDMNTLPQAIMEPSRNIAIEEKERPIPIEKGPQIEQAA